MSKNLVKSFSPLIASSLALTLGMSVAVAQPQITVNNGLEDKSQEAGIIWNGVPNNPSAEAGNNTNIYQPVFEGEMTPIENLIFQFGVGEGLIYAKDDQTKTNTVKTGSDVHTITFDAKGKGIQIGANGAEGKDGAGTLSFEFFPTDKTQSTPDQKRRVELKFSGIGESLKGNLLIKAGKPSSNHIYTGIDVFDYYKNTNTLLATFAGNMTGNITIETSGVEDLNGIAPEPLHSPREISYNDLLSVFEFSNGELKGNIKSHAGDNTFVFKKEDTSFKNEVYSGGEQTSKAYWRVNIRNKVVVPFPVNTTLLRILTLQ